MGSKRLFGLMLFMLIAVLPEPVRANMCQGNYLHNVHRSEALELENSGFSSNSECARDVGRCFIGERSLNEMILACNRSRDYFSPGGSSAPLGPALDRRSAAQRTFADDLPRQVITGQYKFLGLFLKHYQYLLERRQGQWIATSVLDFQFPGAERDKLHIPLDLAGLLSVTAHGPTLESGECAAMAVDKHSNGLVDYGNGSPRACRVDRNSTLFLHTNPLPGRVAGSPPTIVKGHLPVWVPLPDSFAADGSRPVTEWLMLYWRRYIEHYWSRTDGSFRMNIEIANLAGRPGEITTAQLAAYRRMDAVYAVELHHNETRLNNMYRPIEVLGLKIYKAIYAGEKFSEFVHEFGHSIGLGDDYATGGSPPTNRDCNVLSGFRDPATGAVSKQNEYVMCYGGREAQHIKSVYLWIITQRYSVSLPLRHCLDADICPDGQFCQNGLPSHCTRLKTVGDNCSTDHACAPPASCVGKPLGKCRLPGTRSVDESCLRDSECISGHCANSICVCADNSDCSARYGAGFLCSKQTLKANQCVQACTSNRQCASGKCFQPPGTTFKRCK